MSTFDPARLLEPLTDLAKAASRAILDVPRGGLTAVDKVDGSPVTQADHNADAIIADGLMRLAPDIPVVSEERVDAAGPNLGERFFLIDPLDGTREYIAGRAEYTVNIALIVRGTPVLGIVAAPALKQAWRGIVGRGAERLTWDPDLDQRIRLEPIRTRRLPRDNWVATVSRSHLDAATEAFLATRPCAARHEVGSAVKFCRIAEGQADVYPRLAQTSEWDVGAGHAVVVAAGGKVTDGAGQPLSFGRRQASFLIPNFIVWGDVAAGP